MAGLPEIGSPGPAGFNDWVIKNLSRIALWSRGINAGTIGFKETTSFPYKNIQEAIEGAQLQSAILDAIAAKGALLSITRITASGTYTLPSNVGAIFVRIVGGGGSGGGAASTSGSSVSVGSGGGAGGYVDKFITSPASSATVTIGAGASGNSAANGSAGGASSFVDGTYTLSAGGGSAGLILGADATTFQSFQGGIASGASGGDANIIPARAERSFRYPPRGYGGSGGSGPFGGGGGGTEGTGSSGGQTGGNGNGYGSGGGGSLNAGAGGSTARPGGDGTDGYCEVWEFAG